MNLKVFSLESSAHCQNDYIQISALKQRLCSYRDQGRVLRFNNTQLIVMVFKTNALISGEGFAIEITDPNHMTTTQLTTSPRTDISTTPGQHGSGTPSSVSAPASTTRLNSSPAQEKDRTSPRTAMSTTPHHEIGTRVHSTTLSASTRGDKTTVKSTPRSSGMDI